MSEKHTPGPWTVEDVTSGYDHDICLGYQVPRAGNPILLATVFFDQENDGPISCYQANANARLIAAAPVGYELASEILRACDPSTGREISDVTRREIEPLRLLAERFIASVEGTDG